MTLTRCWSRTVAVLVVCFWPPLAFADMVILDHDTPVYLKPKITERPYRVLKQDTEIQVDRKPIRGFRRVLVDSATDLYAFVKESDLNLDEIELERQEKAYAFGASLMSGISSQGARTFQTADQVTYRTNGYSGSYNHLGVFFDYRMASWFSARFTLAYESIKKSGQAEEVGNPIAAKNVTINQSGLAYGMQLKFDVTSNHIWLGVGALYEVASSLTLKLDDAQVPTQKSDLPRNFSISAIAGWDFYVGESWMICPDLRYVVDISASPAINSYAATISGGYRY